MIKFDFPYIVDNKSYFSQKEVENKLKEYYMTGFNLANKVKSYSDCLIVIGIGGSFLGSMAVNEALKKYFDTTSFPIIYTGTTFSSEYLNRLINYLKDKDYTLNVVSKSGSTLETKITYDILKNEMQKNTVKKKCKNESL